jgi:hypothetical protein
MLRDIFGKKISGRVLDNQSTREIADTRKRLKSELRASLYLYDDSIFIVCAIAGSAEHGEPAVLSVDTSDDELGITVCDKLLAFNPRELARREDLSLSKWRAYNVSGAKSAKAFERHSFYAYISTVNAAITIDARPRITNEKDLSALCAVSTGQRHSEIGEAVRKAINASKVLREAGVL